jgi:Domain of unknown function (DUF4386)
MAIYTVDESQRKAAKVAGFTYLFTLPFVVFANFAIHDRLIVPGNAAETARNIMAHERLFRVSIACDLIYCAGLVVLLTALYVILQPVNRGLALLAAFSRLVYALMWVLMTLNLFYALRPLTTCEYLKQIDYIPWRGYTSARVSSSITLACCFGDWHRQFAATCGLSRTISLEPWLPSE